jgi:choline dehydrogenase-like flavoprotein
MILDSRDASVPLDRSVQVAIVGAGPAGMTLARELASGAQVLLIESGGFDDNAAQQELLVGECAGIDYPLTETRARQFGGSSALWAGYCAIFDAHDFAQRDWVPRSGWPFTVDALAPYYAKTAAMLNLGELNFDARDIAARAGITLPFDNETVVPTVWRFGTPTIRFGEQLRSEFAGNVDLMTLIHANVVDIRLNADRSRVEELVVRTLSGREGRITADLVVLACGGIENPRLLLNSNSQISAGIGNGSDLVGRCFMEHPHMSTALLLDDRDRFESWSKRDVYDDGLQFSSLVGIAAPVQAAARILNARCHIYRTPSMDSDERPRVGIFMEQAPNLNSRVTLGDAVDSLGLRRARLDWRLSELDWITYEKTVLMLAREFERLGAGHLAVESSAVREGVSLLHSNHQLGTTRMSKDPKDGVVNAQCRVHDLENLYIAGGSVYPTVSWANPTFTLLSLTLRLADHLRLKVASIAR